MPSTPYHHLVAEYARLLQAGRAFPLGTFPPAPRPEIPPKAPKALFFAPHPDDECIFGALAVRLMRQAGVNVINVAVTQGSNKERQAARFAELKNACDYLGFGLVATGPNGLERINLNTRQQDPAHWSACVQVIRNLLAQHQPRVVFCPHDRDWNSTHIGTHYLVLDALQQMPAGFECDLVETEFWGQMSDPNLMVEISAQDLADMMAALSFHVGEVGRNPYHLLLPAWMIDNVRRGAEIVGGQGGAAPDYPFAVLYRLRRWSGGQVTKLFEGGKQVPCSMNVNQLFG
ncbi:MAG TPA: PIG-L family deacetylase [Bacillota bacterium]|nr:PIG-L family deacetylase [Bacillota bacterium]